MSHSLTDLAGLAVRAEDFLAAVLESAAQPLCVMDPEGRIRFASPAAISALGYDSADELFGRRCHETIHYQHPDGTPYPAAECPMSLRRTSGERATCDLDWFSRRDGSMFPVSWVSVPLEMAEGLGTVLAFAEVVDRVRAERVLPERDSMASTREDALRRIAALVAGGARSEDVFAAIAREIGHVLGLRMVVLVWRYEPGEATATIIGAWSEDPHPFQIGTRWPLDGPTLLAQVRKTGRPARLNDYAKLRGTIAEAVRKTGLRAAAGVPIIVSGHVWGAMTATAYHGPLPDHMEDRLAEFTELVAAAISNTASRDQLARMADAQAALRRVATLVAGGVPPPEVFAAVAREVGLVLGVEWTHMARYEPDGTSIGVGGWSPAGDQIPVGTRVALEPESVGETVLRTGRPARLQSYEQASGDAGALGRERGLRSAVGAPIVVDGRLWGMMMAATKADVPLPADAESRLESFTELVATAISNAAARTETARLADEQAALRRVATLVARGVRPDEIFAAVSDEVGRLVGTDSAAVIKYDDDGEGISYVGSASKVSGAFPVGTHWKFQEGMASFEVHRTGRSARSGAHLITVDGPIGDLHRRMGIISAVASPIMVEGRLWGAMAVHGREPLPLNTEERLEKFTELVATAIANAESRSALTRLAEEQAALRRVATLVAKGVRADEIFATVSDEVRRLLGADSATVLRFDDDGPGIVFVGVASKMSGAFPLGAKWKFAKGMSSADVYRTGRSARSDAQDWSTVEGPVGETHRRLGIVSAAASPVVVEGRLWGAVSVQSQGPLPLDAEERLEKFGELVATAIANAESRAELARLAGEQAALRRVATLVAEESSPAAVFAQVAEELASVLGDVQGALVRDEGDGTASTVAVWGDSASAVFPVGGRIPLPADSVVASALREGGPSRIDDYSTATGTISQGARALAIRSAVGCPIVVAGRPWGAMAVASRAVDAFPPDTESRIAQFSDLVATAIANAGARAEVQRLAEEQAALRRVATLVANGSPQGEVLAAVAEEMGRLLRGAATATWRYGADGTATVVAVWDEAGTLVPIGTRVTPGPDSVSGIVLRTGRPARTDGDADVTDPRLRDTGPRCTVGAPIVVNGQLWGVMLAAAQQPESLPAGTERHMDEFTKLVATAISNVQARSELAASRARIVAAADEERRRVVRDLHDGAQQRLVHTIVTLKLAHRALRNEKDVTVLMNEALTNAEEANVELRELAHGILPAALAHGGLRAGVDALALRMPVPVENGVSADRLPAAVEATAYFVIAEALTNTAKHASAGRAAVSAHVEDGILRVRVRDDGVGGARPDGPGLLGLADRLAVLDGQFRVESPADGGTVVTADIPVH